MSKGIFITGTGTDVGKTYVTGLIVKKLRETRVNAGYYKAALSGAPIESGVMAAGDARDVCRISGLQAEDSALVSYIYKDAVSPHLAAQIEDNPIQMDKLVSDFSRVKTQFDYITAEGSGGIVCPLRLDEKKIMLTDVIKTFSLDIMIVSLSGLGAINSTVLTVEHARRHNLSVKGIILNRYEHDNLIHRDNQKQIEFLTGVPVISCIAVGATDCGINAQTLMGLYEEI